MKQNRMKTLLIRYGTQSCYEEHRLKHHREIDIKILSTCTGIIYILPTCNWINQRLIDTKKWQEISTSDSIVRLSCWVWFWEGLLLVVLTDILTTWVEVIRVEWIVVVSSNVPHVTPGYKPFTVNQSKSLHLI